MTPVTSQMVKCEMQLAFAQSNLFANVKRVLIAVFPFATKNFTNNWIIRFFDAVWLDIKSGDVKFDDLHEALDRIFNFRRTTTAHDNLEIIKIDFKTLMLTSSKCQNVS